MNYFVPDDEAVCKTDDGRVYRYCASLHKKNRCPDDLMKSCIIAIASVLIFVMLNVIVALMP